MSYAEALREHLRITILRLLAEAPDYECNDAILRDLLAEFGLHPTRDQLGHELAWLAEQGLVKREEIKGLVVAALTNRGADVAHGAALVPGVRRPGPKD